MSKGYKIKRHNTRIYRRGERNRARSPWAIAGLVVLVVGLFVVGWFVYPPIYDLLTNRESRPSEASESSPDPSQAGLEGQSEPEEPAAAPDASGEMRAVYAPTAVMGDSAKLDGLMKSAAAAGYNTVLFDGKDAAGQVLYRSSLPRVLEAGAVAANAFDLSAAKQAADANGMRLAVRLNAFRDHYASSKFPDMQIKYQGGSGAWLDDYQDRGGRTWLNPYHTGAQDYVVDLAKECAKGGVTTVLLDGLQFPNVLGSELATYGDTGGLTKKQALQGFVARAGQELEPLGVRMLACAPVSAVMEIGGLEYLGRPAAYPAALAVNAMPALWGAGSAVAGLENPVQKPYDTVLTTLRAAGEKTDSQLVPFVQAYTDGTVPAASNLEYGKAQVEEQMRALTELAIREYILYNPDGSYLF